MLVFASISLKMCLAAAEDPAEGPYSAPQTPRSAAHKNVGGGGARPRRQHSHRVIRGIIRRRLKTPDLTTLIPFPYIIIMKSEH